jgi:hypothetical protein
MKGGGRQEPPDRSHQLFVRHGTERCSATIGVSGARQLG